MNTNTIRASRSAALILGIAGLITVITGSSATANVPTVEQPVFCADTSLHPRTADAAEAWLRACRDGDSDNDQLPRNADAAEAWLR